MNYQLTFNNGNHATIDGVKSVDYNGDYVVFKDDRGRIVRGVAKRNLLSFTRIEDAPCEDLPLEGRA